MPRMTAFFAALLLVVACNSGSSASQGAGAGTSPATAPSSPPKKVPVVSDLTVSNYRALLDILKPNLPALADEPKREASETSAAFQARHSRWQATAESNLKTFYREWGFFDFSGRIMGEPSMQRALASRRNLLKGWECNVADVEQRGSTTRIMCRVYQGEEWAFRIEPDPYGSAWMNWNSSLVRGIHIGDRLTVTNIVQGAFKEGKWYFFVDGTPKQIVAPGSAGQ